LPEAPPLEIHGCSLYRSFAAGGFSNVWGAVIGRIPASELEDWPIGASEIAPHYDAVHELVRGSVGPDPHPSSQARTMHANLSAHRKELADEGISFDYAQLAVRTKDENGLRACRYCGLCLFGCPYDSRYVAASTLDTLVQRGLVTYLPGVMVDRLSPADGRIRIDARSLRNGGPLTFSGHGVFLAAGLLETARIILGSLRIYDTPLHISHSDIFTLPILR
jgi:choline dehydrogenase-like flavoprotein